MRREEDRPPVGGYVLAGGKSSRMGRDKALLKLAGKPLVEHAVTKLRGLCTEVKILGSDPALEAFAPVVRDRHTECGPMGGIEAALLDSEFEWNLVLPVDMPFVSCDYLGRWLGAALRGRGEGLRLAMVTVDGMPQPTLLIVHRDVAPFLTATLEAGKYKLVPALEEAGRVLAGRLGAAVGDVFWRVPSGEFGPPELFANVNTPEEFAEAERYAAGVDGF